MLSRSVQNVEIEMTIENKVRDNRGLPDSSFKRRSYFATLLHAATVRVCTKILRWVCIYLKSIK